MTEGYCVKCKKKQEMLSVKEVLSKKGVNMAKGKCPVCGTNMCRMLGKKKLEAEEQVAGEEPEETPEEKMPEEYPQEEPAVEYPQEYPQQLAYPPGLYGPEKEKESAEIGVIKELRPDNILKEIRMELKGFEYDALTKKWKKVNDPLMNNTGINLFMTTLSAVSRLVTFSNYDVKEINSRVLWVMETVIPPLYIGYKDYGIKDKKTLEFLQVQLFMFTEAALNKAKGAGDRGVIGRTIQESILARPQQQPIQDKSFMNKINPFSK